MHHTVNAQLLVLANKRRRPATNRHLDCDQTLSTRNHHQFTTILLPTFTNYSLLPLLLLLLSSLSTVLCQQTASSIVTRKPSDGKATLVPGQDLLLECEKTGDKKANFKWYRTRLNSDTLEEVQPEDEAYEIHNERLWIKKSGLSSVADYHCRALKGDSSTPDKNEEAIFRVRTQPFIEDFDLATSHTGRSGIITDGERLELKCEVKNSSGPVNITWLKSKVPDDEETMVDLEDNANFNSHIKIVKDNPNMKTLIIQSVSMEDRGYYLCRADNEVTDKGSRTIFIRVRDKLIALWPLLGIISELAILFSIIFIWENQRANNC